MLSLFLFSFVAFSASEESILGVWWSPEQKTKVEIKKNGDRVEGTIIAVRPESENKLNEKDENKSNRTEKILGLKILNNFKYNGDRWMDGTIYDPENGKTYKSILWFNDKDQSVLYVRGYVGFALIGRTAEFRRVEGESPRTKQENEPNRIHLKE